MNQSVRLMMPSPYPSIAEHLAWAKWWAFPWRHAHDDWKGDEYRAVDALYRSRRWTPRDFMGVTACLPPTPPSTVLHLALASEEQLSLALTLVHRTFRTEPATPLSDSHHLWCMRLSKALPPDMLLPSMDPLQLLHSWVEPATWQRLRLRFSRERVQRLEGNNTSLENANSRLNTLWQAVVWRIKTLPDDTTLPDSNAKEASDVMPIHH